MHVHNHCFTGPSALTTVNITKNIENSSVDIQWDAVDDFLLTTYIITWGNRIDQGATLIEQTSYTITGLTIDTVYTITVSAANTNCGGGPEFRTRITLSIDTTSTTSTISPTVTASTNTSTIISTANSSSTNHSITSVMMIPNTTTNLMTTLISKNTDTDTDTATKTKTTTINSTPMMTYASTITTTTLSTVNPTNATIVDETSKVADALRL